MKNILIRYKGNFLVILSAILFGSMPLFVKIINENGGNLVLLTFLRSLISLPLLFMLMRHEGNRSLISLVEFKKILVLSLGFSTTPILLLTSYDFIPSGMAMTIHFVYPVFVLIACLVFFKDKPNGIKTIGLALCSLGIFLFFDPGQKSNSSGIVLAFLSGITYAFYTIYLDKSDLRTMKPFTLGFYLAIVASVELGIFAFLTDSLDNSLNVLGWVLCILYSLLITVGASISFQEGVKEIGSQRASILSTFEPITSILVGILVFSEAFGFKTIIGIIMILAAVVLLTAFDKKEVTSELDIRKASGD